MTYDPKVILKHLKRELIDDTFQDSFMWLQNTGVQDRVYLAFQVIKIMRRFSLDDENMKRILQVKFFLTMAEATELLEKERLADGI